jgi:excisionase family DNA binding protein
MKCRRCLEPFVLDGDWERCSCDDDPGLALTVREAASYICMSRSHIYALIADGTLTASRKTRPARIPMTSIKAWFAAHNRAFRLGLGCYRP